MEILRNVYLDPKNLIITNNDLDDRYINFLIEGLLSGEIHIEELEPIYVGFSPNQGFFVKDGNHRSIACIITDQPVIQAELDLIHESVENPDCVE